MKQPFLIFISFAFIIVCKAQSNIVFQHLNTGNGLSYLGVNDMCTDNKGNLWIATGNGLNMFNGKTTEKYLSSEYPQLQSSNIIHVTCDGDNRIWVLTANGYVTMLDEKRQLHRIRLYEQNKWIRTRWILNSQNGNIILFTAKGHYAFNAIKRVTASDSLSNNNFSFLPINHFDTLLPKGFNQVFYFDDRNYLFVQGDAFFKVNYIDKKVEKKISVSNSTALIKWGSNELMMYDRIEEKIKLIDLTTEKASFPFENLKDQFGQRMKGDFRFAEIINGNRLLLTTADAGIYIYDIARQQLYHHTHHFTDPFSIASNNATTLTVAKNGCVFITCNPNGISYFNSNAVIGSQNVFTDTKGNGYDGVIAGLATKDNNIYYLGTSEGLLQWNRNINSTRFINFTGENDGKLFKKEEIHSVAIDDKGRIWAATQSQGIIILDKNNHFVKQFKKTGNSIYKLRRATFLLPDSSGYMWASGDNGICKINTNTFKIENFENTALATFDSIYCNPLLFTDKNNLWVATYNSGVFHYNFLSKKLDVYNASNGLIGNTVFCLNADQQKNIYVGTKTGLNILYRDGRIKTITQKNGLLIDRAEGLLLDKQNRMWIGNDIGIVCYNPADSTLTSFDERFGLSVYGFRVGSYFKTPNGEFVFGTPRGLQYFFPDSLINKKVTLRALINKIETKETTSNLSSDTEFKLAASDNQVSFHFSIVDFSPHVRTYYQYQLEGFDKEWIMIADQHSVRYNALPPGKFIFKIRASNNNKNWTDAENNVTIIIATAFYKTGWFKLLATLISIGLILFVIDYYRKKQLHKQSELETELVITWFASRINSHQKTNELLWDVAKNCISKLHFEDCVIYLIDEERNMLVQKAAYGPKNPIDFTIHKPLEIPVGKGIVGKVAATGKHLLVSNTADDPDYITDDKRRNSEIAVPIMINNKVIGVIDSEHSRKNFFTQKHLQVLTTIAVLCANQIQKSTAEEETQLATIELLENKQKAIESRLQSLRLQMNPHFLFNALNSIQQMILANEDVIATRYLSKFAKLLRTILVHSDKETISLKEDIDMLKLYIELESIRFKDSFQYSITCDEEIDIDEVKIPVLLIQPFVENAIWHGLMHKEGNRLLTLKFMEDDNNIICTIEDNGIGRKQAATMKAYSGKDHTSKGIAVSQERLKTLKYKKGSINIIDLEDSNGLACGTRIEIYLPNQNKDYA